LKLAYRQMEAITLHKIRKIKKRLKKVAQNNAG
jgi:hypothetical protein